MNLRELLLEPSPGDKLRELADAGEIIKLEPVLTELTMTIPRGYNHKDNFDHSIRVLENAISFEKGNVDIILRTAALLHDIGKKRTREFENNGKVSFKNHEVVGARMVKKILPKHGYSLEETSKISNLIRLHMRSYNFSNEWTDSAVRRLITDAGDNLQLERLIIIFRSDITTKHEHKSRKILRKIDMLESAFNALILKDLKSARRPALNGLEVAEILGITPGKGLKNFMNFLNSEEGLSLTREEAITRIKSMSGSVHGVDVDCE